MAPEKQRLIPELFHQALEQPGAAREAFLKRACAGDDELFVAVHSLLANHQERDSFLEVSAMQVAAQMMVGTPSIEAGTQLGRYKITAPLGRGGMGEVFRARDDLSREVAIKILPSHYAADPERASRFEYEARTLAQLNHPNIAAIYGREEAAGVRYLVLECVPGETLAERLSRGPLPVEEALKVFGQIADALAATHEAGVIHRDFKPANVMLTPKGTVKLLDFGIAKHFRGDAPPTFDSSLQTMPMNPAVALTHPGGTPGTVAYMSPELLAGDFAAAERDARALDLWAFGLVLYEALTGTHPFRGQTGEETKTAIVRLPPDWQAIPASVPRKIETLLRACLEKNPEHRLRDAAEARRLIDEAAHPSPFMLLQEKYRVATFKTKVTAAGLVLLALLGAGWFAYRSFVAQAHKTPTRLAVVAWTGEDAAQSCDAGRSKALARLLTDRLRDVRGLQVVPGAVQSDRALPLLMTDLSLPQLARTAGADTVLRVAAECPVGASGNGFKYSLVGRDGQVVATGVETDFRRLIVSVLSTLDVRSGAADWRTSDAEQRYYQALALLDQYASEQSVNDAVKILEELKDQDPANRARTLSALGLGWYLKSNLTGSVADKERAVGYCDGLSGSPVFDALVRCGVVLSGTGHADQAVSNFENALRERPDDTDAVLGLAQAYEQRRDAAKAEQQYLRAVALRPDYWGGYNELGGFYFEQGRYALAAQHWQTVTSLLPLNPHGWSNLGNAQLYQGQFAAAQASFNRSLEQRRTPDAYQNLGIALVYASRCDDAAEAFEQGTRLNKEDAELWGWLGDARACGKAGGAASAAAYDNAIELMKDKLTAASGGEASAALLAEWLAKRGRIEQAMTRIQQALTRSPDDAFTALSAVKVFHLAGREQEALEFVARAAAHANSRFDLEHAPELAGMRASAAFRDALSRAPREQAK